MPGEDEEAMDRDYEHWRRYFRSGNPAVGHLVKVCFRSMVLSDRTTRTHENCLQAQVEANQLEFLTRRAELLEKKKVEIVTRPAESVAALKMFGAGLDWLTQRWSKHEFTIKVQGYWTAADCAEVIRLTGAHPELDRLKESPTAYVIAVCNATCQAAGNASANANASTSTDLIALLRSPEIRPADHQGLDMAAIPQTPEACRRRLESLVALELERLSGDSQRLTVEKEAEQLEQILGMSLTLKEENDVGNSLKYNKEANMTFFRAYRSLEEAMKNGANRADEDDPPPPTNGPGSGEDHDEDNAAEATDPIASADEPAGSSTEAEEPAEAEPDYSSTSEYASNQDLNRESYPCSIHVSSVDQDPCAPLPLYSVSTDAVAIAAEPEAGKTVKVDSSNEPGCTPDAHAGSATTSSTRTSAPRSEGMPSRKYTIARNTLTMAKATRPISASPHGPAPRPEPAELSKSIPQTTLVTPGTARGHPKAFNSFEFGNACKTDTMGTTRNVRTQEPGNPPRTRR